MSRNKISKQISAMSTVALINEIETIMEAYASPSLSFGGHLLDEVRDRLLQLQDKYDAAVEELRQLRIAQAKEAPSAESEVSNV